MNRPRSTKRLIADLLDHFQGNAATLAERLAMANHRLSRAILRPHILDAREVASLRILHGETFPDEPDAGDLHDIPDPTAPTKGHPACLPSSPGHSQADAPSTPSKTEEPPTSSDS